MGFASSKVGNHFYIAIRERGHSSTKSFNILARRLASIAWEVLKRGRDFDPALPKVG
ncbi:IS110 family transposase [Stenotrophomonas maltophilia]|nr:IS110 family transposase [Stenotrophomonas maltophilia]